LPAGAAQAAVVAAIGLQFRFRDDAGFEQGRLVLPFGDAGLSIKAHCLAVPKSKESLESVQTVLGWIRSWMGGEASPGAAAAASHCSSLVTLATMRM